MTDALARGRAGCLMLMITVLGRPGFMITDLGPPAVSTTLPGPRMVIMHCGPCLTTDLPPHQLTTSLRC